MREILFRGKLISTGEWSEGNLAVHKDGVTIITPDATLLGKYGRVDPETVGQYTGLTDENGTKIFEGDIVDIFRDFERGIIKWDEDTARFIISSDGIIADFDNYWGKDLEVIGNIYDNSKLL